MKKELLFISINEYYDKESALSDIEKYTIGGKLYENKKEAIKQFGKHPRTFFLETDINYPDCYSLFELLID